MMKNRTLCLIAEWLKLQRLAWGALLFFAGLGFLVAIAFSVAKILGHSSPAILSAALDYIRRTALPSDEAAGYLRDVSFFLLPLAATFFFVVCQQRKAVINTLADSYYRNYLSKLREHDDRTIVLIKPTFGLCADEGNYLRDTIRLLEAKLKVELREEYAGSPGRSVYAAYRSSLLLPLVFDFCRNQAILGDIVRNEVDGKFGGIFCRPEYKFEFLSKKVFERLEEEHLSNLRDKSRVRVVAVEDVSSLADLVAEPKTNKEGA
ncbi:hypothetical protein [Neotabrizicola sp. sgz301269]|uniref:hypothetical protein n=1 Tax=Neotabrizicola sp. sgz301269 TaxID=3276282 RepID=UPI0037706C93